jgi:hypothetical protein
MILQKQAQGLNFTIGRAIAQAVSRCFSTAAARVSARVLSSAICGAGAGFLRAHRFPLPIFIPPNLPSSHTPGSGTIGQLVADMQSGPSLDYTPPLCELLLNIIIISFQDVTFQQRPARRTDNLVAICENVGASTSRNPKGLHGLYRDKKCFRSPLQKIITFTF